VEIWCEEEQNDVEKQRQNRESELRFVLEEAALSSFLYLRLITNLATSIKKNIRNLMSVVRERETHFLPPELALNSCVVTLITPCLKN